MSPSSELDKRRSRTQWCSLEPSEQHPGAGGGAYPRWPQLFAGSDRPLLRAGSWGHQRRGQLACCPSTSLSLSHESSPCPLSPAERAKGAHAALKVNRSQEEKAPRYPGLGGVWAGDVLKLPGDVCSWRGCPLGCHLPGRGLTLQVSLLLGIRPTRHPVGVGAAGRSNTEGALEFSKAQRVRPQPPLASRSSGLQG